MNIKKLKEEINKESYKSDPRSLIDVIDVDTLIDIIDELQAENNEVLDLVSDMFSFANYLEDKYTYFDNTEHGDTYTDNITGKEFTEKQIYCKWLRWK